jgi:hypothetical protein
MSKEDNTVDMCDGTNLYHYRCVSALRDVSSQLGPIGAAIQTKLAATTDEGLREQLTQQKKLALELYDRLQVCSNYTVVGAAIVTFWRCCCHVFKVTAFSGSWMLVLGLYDRLQVSTQQNCAVRYVGER